MDTVQENELRSTNWDEDLWLNRVNHDDVSNSIRKCLTRLYQSNSSALLKELGGDNSNSVNATELDDLRQLPEPSPLPADNEMKDEAAWVQGEEQWKRDQEGEEHKRLLGLQTAADRGLSDFEIECTNISFMKFASLKCSSRRKRVDLDFFNMPTVFDEETLPKILIFCHLVLNSGLYWFIIVIKIQFATLYDIPKEKGFKAFDHSLQNYVRCQQNPAKGHYGLFATLWSPHHIS